MTNRKEITPEEVERALEGSITKWQNIVDGMQTDHGENDCPLCAIFYSGVGCDGCPVRKRTGKDYCNGSPYVEFRDEQPESIGYLVVAKKELAFLISLREHKFLPCPFCGSDDIRPDGWTSNMHGLATHGPGCRNCGACAGRRYQKDRRGEHSCVE